jgi:hypothetical protein
MPHSFKAKFNITLTSTLRQNLALHHDELQIQLIRLSYEERFWDRSEACGISNEGVSETTLGTAYGVIQQDMQCTYRVTLRSVRTTIVAVEKQRILHILSVCLCSLSYPAYNAHALCYNFICGLSGYTIFLYVSHKLHNFMREKTLLNIKCVLTFSTISEISPPKKKWARYDQIFTTISM